MALRRWWTNNRSWPIGYEKLERYIERSKQDESFNLYAVATWAEITAYAELQLQGWGQIHRLIDQWRLKHDTPDATDATRLMAVQVIKVLDWWLIYSKTDKRQIGPAIAQVRPSNQLDRLEETTC